MEATRRLCLWAIAAAAGTAVAGCEEETTSLAFEEAAKQESHAEQTLSLVLNDEIPTLDSSKAVDSLTFTVLAQTQEGLIRLDSQGRVAPGVAESWTVSADGSTYTFHLRNDALWSDGTKVTAEDFEYAWKRTMHPDTAAQYGFMMEWIQGAADYRLEPKRADEVKVQALDERTLEVTLVQPIPFFLEQLAFPIFFPQKRDFVEEQGEEYGTKADKTLYNGPFVLAAWEHEQSAMLKRNESYWDADQVRLQQVNYQVVKDANARENLYRAGQIDRMTLARDQIDRYRDTAEYRVVHELVNGYLQFNRKLPLFRNLKVRQALTYAIDADAYADVVYHNGSFEATGIVPAGTSNGRGGDFRADNGDLLQRDVLREQAKQLLAEGLREVGLQEFPKIRLLADDGTVGKKAAEFLQGEWRRQLGIEIEVDPVPFKLRLQRTASRDYDIVESLWGADYNDPMTFLDLWVTNGDFNESGYSNREFDALIAEAKRESNGEKRMNLLYRAEKILMDDMAVGPTFFRGTAILMKPYVKGLVDRAYGPDYDLKHAYVEGK